MKDQDFLLFLEMYRKRTSCNLMVDSTFGFIELLSFFSSAILFFKLTFVVFKLFLFWVKIMFWLCKSNFRFLFYYFWFWLFITNNILIIILFAMNDMFLVFCWFVAHWIVFIDFRFLSVLFILMIISIFIVILFLTFEMRKSLIVLFT